MIERDGKDYPSNAFAILTGNGGLHVATQCGVFKGTTKAVFVDRDLNNAIKVPDTIDKVPDSADRVPDRTGKVPDTMKRMPDNSNEVPDTTERMPDNEQEQ